MEWMAIAVVMGGLVIFSLAFMGWVGLAVLAWLDVLAIHMFGSTV